MRSLPRPLAEAAGSLRSKTSSDEIVFSPMPQLTADKGPSIARDGASNIVENKAEGALANDRRTESTADPEIVERKERILRALKNAGEDPAALAQTSQNMDNFEARQSQLEAMYAKGGMPPEVAAKKAQAEIRDTYDHICHLVEAGDNPYVPLSKAERAHIAEQLISQAADPSTISQGYHSTCNVTTVEVRTYMRHPAEAAALVVSVAMTGGYTTKDGTRIVLDKDSLTPHDSAKLPQPLDGQRSLASQLFEVTAVNIAYAKSNPNIHYVQTEPVAGSTPPDTGERLMDYSESPPKEWAIGSVSRFFGTAEAPYRQPGLTADKIVQASDAIIGPQKEKWCVVHQNRPGEKTANVTSEQELKFLLQGAKAKGTFPITIVVHTMNEPFYTDSGAGQAGGSGGWHVVNIMDYQPGAWDKVLVDNQWSSDADHLGTKPMLLRDLFVSMQDVKDTQGGSFRWKQVETLSQQHNTKRIPEANYELLLKAQIEGTGAEYKREASPHSFEMEKAKKCLVKMIADHPPLERLDLIERAHKFGLLSADECSLWMAQQQNKLVRGSSGVEEKDTDKVYERIQKIVGQLPQKSRDDFERSYQKMVTDGLAVYDNRPFPA